MTASIADIRAHHAKVEPGPWRWYGQLKHGGYYLATYDRGRQFIMRFRRKGMQGAEPCFRDKKPGEEWSEMRTATELAVRERDYRDDIDRIDNPHAEYVARSWEYIEVLLAEVDRLSGAACKSVKL